MQLTKDGVCFRCFWIAELCEFTSELQKKREEREKEGEQREALKQQSLWFNYFNYHPLSDFRKKCPLKDAGMG